MGLTVEDIKLGLAVLAFLGGIAVWVWGQNQARLLASAMADKDLTHIMERLNAIDRRLDQSGQKASDEGDRITVKIADVSERLVRVETKVLHL